jgi:hypothetical protein
VLPSFSSKRNKAHPATSELSCKEERAGAHRNGVPTVRQCKRRRAAVTIATVSYSSDERADIIFPLLLESFVATGLLTPAHLLLLDRIQSAFSF